MATDWTRRFGGLNGLADAARARLMADTRVLSVPAGTLIFGVGTMPQNMLLALDGTVRVFHTSEGGREIVLYRVEAGQSCVLTTACLLSHEVYTAEGVAETAVTAAAIPTATFNTLVAESPEFRNFVFSAYAQRITDLFRVIDDVAFGRIDTRLAARLLALARGGDTLVATHQHLATELGTAREVVSRQLHEFQRRGWIETSRGQIRLTERASLARVADPD